MLSLVWRASRAVGPRGLPSRLPRVIPSACSAVSVAPGTTASDAANSTHAPSHLQIDPAHVVQPAYTLNFAKEIIPDMVWQDMDKWQNKVAVECGLTGRRLTYAQLRDASRRMAVVLRSQRLLGDWTPLRADVSATAGTPGPAQVAVIMSNAPEFAIVLLGAMETGAVLSTVNPHYTPEEVSRQLVDCGARLVFVDAGSLSRVMEAFKLLKGPQPTLVLAGPGDAPANVVRLDDLIGPGVSLNGGKLWEEDPEVLGILPYSSGTTGLPKGVLLSQRNIVANLRQQQHPSALLTREAHGDFQERVPAILPFFHIYGLVVVLLHTLSKGAHIITIPSFQPDSFIDIMIKYKASALFAAPPLMLFLASEKASPKALQNLYFASSGAAPLGAQDIDRFMARGPPDLAVVQGFGMTEASPVLLHSQKGNPASVGKPVPSTEVVVVDLETLKSLPSTSSGELCFRGPQVMQGYWNRPEETASTLAEGGWLRSGDLGCTRDDGNFVILDRAKELIKVKGFQVAPAELEELLRAHESVSDAAVIGVNDERAGELPLAYVVPRVAPASAAAAAALRQQLAESVASRVAPYKRLAGGVRLVAGIPKSASGKILRRELRANPPPDIGM